MGSRSVFYPISSLGNNFTFYVVQVTGSNLTSSFSFIETPARASLKTHLPGSPSNGTKRVGQRTDVYGSDAAKIPPFGGGERVLRIYTGLGSRSICYPYSSVGNTFTIACEAGFLAYINFLEWPLSPEIVAGGNSRHAWP